MKVPRRPFVILALGLVLLRLSVASFTRAMPRLFNSTLDRKEMSAD
jgi:hypothetical protein